MPPLTSPTGQPAQSRSPSRPVPDFPKPLLRLEFRDLSHKGAALFIHSVDTAVILRESVRTVLSSLYPELQNMPELPTDPTQWPFPPTRSVTLIVRSMPGVAYTTGMDLDDNHKEIHLSADYIESSANRLGRAVGKEIAGVCVHEMVHCWQWAGAGNAPPGLIEGVADWVRLKGGLSPPHWKRPGKNEKEGRIDGNAGIEAERGGKTQEEIDQLKAKQAKGDWDAGYQHTAFFLDWLEHKFGHGTIVKLNQTLRLGYQEGPFWRGLFKKDVHTLYDDYWHEMTGEGSPVQQKGGDMPQLRHLATVPQESVPGSARESNEDRSKSIAMGEDPAKVNQSEQEAKGPMEPQPTNTETFPANEASRIVK